MNAAPSSAIALLMVAITVALAVVPQRARSQDAGVTTLADAQAPALAAPVEYTAVATASRLTAADVPSPTTVTTLSRAQIAGHPTLTRDALLRAVPSVGTFRRSTSLNADPSSQGLNLRGVAPSGVSRALVLVDGVPASDPFSGSVYYRALPRLGLERVEIVPGGGSALYGSSALSGVVQLLSRSTQSSVFEAETSYGVANTVALAAYGSGGTRTASGSLEGEWLSSDGFPVVAKSDRGAIDHNARSLHGTLIGRANLRAGSRLKISSAVGLFSEVLRGATRYTNATAQLANASLRARYDAHRRGRWDLMLFGRLASFDQERARVLEQRSSEALAARQYVPAHDEGSSLVWSQRQRRGTQGQAVSLGLDLRHVQGRSRERLFPAAPSAGVLRARDTGGQQLFLGAFAEHLYQHEELFQLSTALRVDFVRNFAGRRILQPLDQADQRSSFADSNAVALSPRLGLLVQPSSWLRIRSAAYRSFRAPTLNELYRPFQVGTVLTAANERLEPEYLIGGELGLEWLPWQNLKVRTTGFWNRLDAPIINTTLPAPLEDGATRQRQNSGRARIAGVEAAVELTIAPRWTWLLAYTLADTRVTKAGSNAPLRHKRLAQDPVHRASALLTFDDPRLLSATLQVRFQGRQFEDDLNTLPMHSYWLVDVLLARRLLWQLELFGAVENLFDELYLVGRAGIDTIGAPFLARVGLRIREAAQAAP